MQQGRLPEFIASTLPPPQQWRGRSIWRSDLGYAQSSDGLQWLPVGALSATQVAAVVALLEDGAAVPRAFAQSLAQYQLTGGTVGVQTVLFEVPIPDGWLDNDTNAIEVRSSWWYSLNTNSKSFGVYLGTEIGTAAAVFSRTRTSATQGQDASWNILMRNPSDVAKIRNANSSGIAYFGHSGVNAASSSVNNVGTIDPSTAGLKLFFTATLDTVNTDQVTLTAVQVLPTRVA